MAIENMNFDASTLSQGAISGGLAATIVAFFLIGLLFAIALYVYMSVVYMKIAKKGKYSTPGIAWIPFVGPALISASLAKMHWWPVLLLLAFPIPILGSIAGIVFLVFMIIWTWRMFEGFGRPGWWAIFWLINIVELVLLGVVAWSDNKYNPKKVPNK